jgi:hypothetical protein
MLGEENPKLDQPLPRTTSLPVVREGRQPTIPLHPPGRPQTLHGSVGFCGHVRALCPSPSQMEQR